MNEFHLEITLDEYIEIPLYDFKEIGNSKYIVYMFIDWNGKIIYVGQSQNFSNRIYNHIHVKNSYTYPYRYLIKSIKVVHCKTKLDMNILETYLINTLEPSLNIEYKLKKDSFREIDQNLISEAKKYKTKWEKEINSKIKTNKYNRDETLNNHIEQIKYNILNNNITLPERIAVVGGESFRRYIVKHLNKNRNEIENALYDIGLELITMKDRYGDKSRYIREVSK